MSSVQRRMDEAAPSYTVYSEAVIVQAVLSVELNGSNDVSVAGLRKNRLLIYST